MAILGQALSPDELADVPDRLNTTLVPEVRPSMQGAGRPAYEKVDQQYSQYALMQPATKQSGSAKVLGYKIPTNKTFQGLPLIASYDVNGNFQYASFPEGQVFSPDPSKPNIVAAPKINKAGGVIDFGAFDVNSDFAKGGFLSDAVSDLGPIALAALGANFAAGNLGSLFSGGAGAAGVPGGLMGSTLPAGAGAGGFFAPGVTAGAATLGIPTMTGAPAGVTPSFAGGQDIAQLQQQLANTPMPPVTSGPPIAGEVVPGALPEIAAGNADKAALYGAEGYGAAASPAELAAGAGGVGLLSSLGGVGTAIMDFAKANPSIAGSLLGAVAGAIGANDAPTSQTATTSIDPQIKQEYLQNLERAKTTAEGLTAREIAQPGQLYSDAERKLYNLGMTPFGAADIERFYNPYQEQVVQGALGDIERTRQMQEQANMAQATRARAFGGSRQGVVSGMTNEAALRQAATTGAQLRQAGFNTAANLGLAARPMDIAGLQTSLGLGTTRTALEQARLDALRNLGTERLAITGGALGLQPANVGQTSTQPLYTSQTGSLLSGGLTGAYIGSLLGKA
jgi:hypothetical protein